MKVRESDAAILGRANLDFRGPVAYLACGAPRPAPERVSQPDAARLADLSQALCQRGFFYASRAIDAVEVLFPVHADAGFAIGRRGVGSAFADVVAALLANTTRARYRFDRGRWQSRSAGALQLGALHGL